MFANPASPALALGLAVLLSTVGIGPAAQSSPPPVDPALRARFGFLGPVRHKSGDGLDLLQVRDLDGDGRAEILGNASTDPTKTTLDGARMIGVQDGKLALRWQENKAKV
ncbi:MAG: hypothetical protein KC613_22585, partial [Myxococcales bacterium]|nr:hypothetical protein [Myxococcales bacterium]